MSGVRPKAAWANPGVLTVVCDVCKREHRFEQISFNEMILDNDPDDDFQIHTPEGNGAQFLHPQFICRNSRCDRGPVTISLPPFKV